MNADTNTVACIQARMESSRLPGKVMFPLAGAHVLEHDVRRVDSVNDIDEVVSLPEAVQHIDQNELVGINQIVNQKSV